MGFLSQKVLKICLRVCVFYVNVCHICVGTCGGQKKVSDPLELELQAICRLPYMNDGN